MKMKICIDCRLISGPGIGTYLKSLLPSLSNDNRLTLKLLCSAGDKQILSSYGECIIMQSSLYTLQEQWQWPRLIPPCDLFWSPHFNVPLLPILAKKRLTTIHDVYHLAFFSMLTSIQKIYAKLMYNAAIVLSDQIITVSQFTAQEIGRFVRIRPKKLKVISNGISSIYESKQKKPFILFVGSPKLHKNLEKAKIAAQELNIELVIVGKGIKEVDNQTLSSLYAHASLLLFPSLYEGFGYPLIEAMALGCPIVASDRGSIFEVCGDAAEYCHPQDVNSIKQAIINVYFNSKRREELVQKGFSRVKKFSLSHTVDEHIKVIYESCDRS